MSEFDPYEHVLRNFSRHKFKAYIDKAILTLESHADEFLPDYGELHKEMWPDHDFAYMDMPTRMGLLYHVTSYNRWMFCLDHIDDGFIRPEAILDNVRGRVTRLSRRLASDRSYLGELRQKLYDRIGHYVSDGEGAYHDPVYGTAIFYYLTNADLDPYDAEYDRFDRAINEEVRNIFLDGARGAGIDLDKADFGVGIGSPKTFLRETRDKALALIQDIETRPDSVNFAFVDGRIKVTCSNKRLFSVYDQDNPQIVLLDQIIDPNSYFLTEEIQEFEALLNRSSTPEAELQMFLEAHPKFLLGVDYDELRPQVSLTDESGQELRPDFFLRLAGERLWDILDIKRATESLIVGRRNRERLAQCVHEGMSQLMNYARFFEDPRNRDRVVRETGIDCCKPRLTLVIGKRRNLDEVLWRQVIEQERPHVNIVGFDDILQRAKKLRVNAQVSW